MRYDNLNELIRESSSSRKFFLSLPVNTQISLHEYNDYIRTAEELRRYVFLIDNHSRTQK
ncbi:MAG: hypothetical protein KHW62_01165 [Clostridiales bacterium]|nr:hypothetical protein [Clostridiales bacterium]